MTEASIEPSGRKFLNHLRRPFAWIRLPMKRVTPSIAHVNHQGLQDEEKIRALHKTLYEYVCKENDLLNHRTTWFLAIQSATFLGFGYVLRQLADNVGRVLDFTPLALLCCIIGWLSSQGARKSIQAGLTAQSSLSRFWDKYYEDQGQRLGLPRLMGGFSFKADEDGAYFAEAILKVTWVGWLLTGAATVLAAIGIGAVSLVRVLF